MIAPTARLGALFVLLLGACTDSPTPPVDGDVSGIWRGSQRDGRADVVWQTRQEPDGAIQIDFLRCFNGEALSSERQLGTAAVVDGHWDIRISEATLTDLRSNETRPGTAFDHTYEFSELSPTRLRYRSDETGKGFEMTRVAAAEALSCPPASFAVDTRPGDQRARDAWITRGPSKDDDAPAPDDATED